MVACRPTLYARGFTVAAVSWLSLFMTVTLAGVPGATALKRQKLVLLVLVVAGVAEACYGVVHAVGGVDRVGF